MKREINALQTQITAAKERLKALIRGLPDEAEGVQSYVSPSSEKLVARLKNCCTVPFSVIGKNKGILSPAYYLSHESKRALLETIESNRSLETLISTMESVIETGHLKDGTKIAPNVLKALKEAWEG